MAQFEGTVDAFVKFIGGFTRNKVQTLTRTYRKNIGKCENCGSRTKYLEAAHIRGKERLALTSNILNNFITDGNLKIDLYDFEDQFCKAHDPLENTIRILCKKCHRKYDGEDTNSTSNIDEDDIAKIEQREIEIVTTLISNSKMNKGKALEFVKERSSIGMNFNNVIYSNVNSAIDVWWMEPSYDKFKQKIYIILNHSNEGRFFLFELPANTIKSPDLVFDQRKDKGAAKLIIKVSTTDFIDKNGFNLNPFLIGNFDY